MNDIFWTYAYREIQQKIQLKYGYKSAELVSMHNSLVMVLSQALGGKPKGAPTGGMDPNAKDVTAGAATVDQAVLAMNRMLSF